MEAPPGRSRTKPIPAWFPRGVTLLREPTLNKGTAFSARERDALGLHGLLPPRVMTQEGQVARILENFRRLDEPARQVHHAGGAAGPERGAVLPGDHR